MKVVNNITLTSGRFDNSIALQQQRNEDSLAVPRPPKNPPLRYPGAKTKVVKTLLAEMPMDWTEFREPFAGGLSLTLCVMQKYPARRYWVNDLDPFVSCFWTVLASQPDQLAKTLSHYLLEYPTNPDKVCLAEWAKRLIHETSGVDRAALYYVISKTSFSGLAFNGFCSCPKNFNARGVDSLLKVGRLLHDADLKVTDLDYADCLTDDPKVFTYFDPPYRIAQGLYGEKGNMHWTFDHRRFAHAVNPIRSRWMLSYNDDLLIRQYFKTHHISTIEVPYVMNTKRIATELLIKNYEN